jgi:hypothetical protein
MLLSCEDDCQKDYENNVARCIAETQLGTPPVPAGVTATKSANSAYSAIYVAPQKTSFEVVETECRRLQNDELNGCKAACGPDCNQVAKTCRSAFNAGTLMEAYCKKAKGC